MNQLISLISLLVKDYDEAIDFYTQKLSFEVVEDSIISETKRWVVIAPKNSNGCKLLLAKAATEEQSSRIGNQTGGRVFLFLHTDNLDRDYQQLTSKGVRIIREPSEESFGKVFVFSDVYGNLWDVIEQK